MPEETLDSSDGPPGWSKLNGTFHPDKYTGSTYWIATNAIRAKELWDAGVDGSGVDVALIDSGVVPVDGLTYPGKVVNGPDFSFESQADHLQYLDTYGHGTHMAGIIAGRDDSGAIGDPDTFTGIAPGARIINVKVADATGGVDVTQVIAAIDWVVQHRTDNGLNIRVLNLSYGTDSGIDYEDSALAFAVEQAWEAGIVVVVAAGNDGNNAMLRDPATDPFIIAVGSADNNVTSTAADDSVNSFSNCGPGTNRNVDVVAPGTSVVSLRNPGSYADENHPDAGVDGRFFVGSGTSQAAAVVAGSVALLLDVHPGWDPDDVKTALTDNADPLNSAPVECQGAGMVDVAAAAAANLPNNTRQSFRGSSGDGPIEDVRGTNHVVHDGVALTGEQDIFGNPFDTYIWASLAASLDSWDGGMWNGASWSGASWSGASWSGASWSGASWSGASWSGASWSSIEWSGASWSGASWSGASWSGASWSGASWSGDVWMGLSWN
jgi:serine protease AprX